MWSKTLISGSVMMMMAVYLVIGSLWITFGLVFETTGAFYGKPGYGIVITTASIIWSAISLVIAIYFIHRARVIIKRVRHEGKA